MDTAKLIFCAFLDEAKTAIRLILPRDSIILRGQILEAEIDFSEGG